MYFETLANSIQSVILTEKNINIIVSFENEFVMIMNFSMKSKIYATLDNFKFVSSNFNCYTVILIK